MRTERLRLGPGSALRRWSGLTLAAILAAGACLGAGAQTTPAEAQVPPPAEVAPAAPSVPVAPSAPGAPSFPAAPATPAAPAAAAPPAAPSVPAPPATAATETRPATPAPPAVKPAAPTRPLWSELSADQQKSLQPLAGVWNGLHPAQKRKWIALSRNFDSMGAEERAILHSRMTEWAALSPQERTRARLNFAEVKRLAPADERKAKWEAYQALSDEEKRKLAERAGTRPPSAAAAVLPVPEQKLAPVPRPSASGQHAPRIQLAPPPGSAGAIQPTSTPPVRP